MNQDVNKNGLRTKEEGPVWKLKIGIHSQLSDNTIKVFKQTKKWKMKVILN